MDHVKTAVSSLEVGAPTTCRGLTVLPLTSGFRSRLRYLLLEEGLRKDLVTIREVTESGSVPELTVENRADVPVLIVDGEELVGAKQNRVANLTMMIPAATTTTIPVSCVEAGRWSYRTRNFDVSDRVQNARGRAEKLASVRRSLRRSGVRRSDQGQVWASLAAEADLLEAPSRTGAMGAMFERHRDTLDDYVGAIEPASDQVGAVFIVGGRRYGLDLFDRPATFAAFLPKLTRSYAIDVLGRRSAEGAPEGDAREFLNRIVEGNYDVHAAVGLGHDVGVVGDGLVAGALVTGRTVVHLAAFAEADRGSDSSPDDESHGARYANYRQRRDSMRNRRRG